MPLEYLAVVALPFIIAFFVALVFAPGVISSLRRLKMGQVISVDGPESHKSKAGTPSMGGLIILAGVLGGVLVASIVTQKLGPMFGGGFRPSDLLAVLLLMLGYAIIGMIDDYLTIKPRGGVRGISSKPKAALQFLLAIAFVAWFATTHIERTIILMDNVIWLGWWYWALAVVYIVGLANFVNITDGLDGLAAGLIAILCLGLIAVLTIVPNVPGLHISLLAAIAGACLAFLWFNANPAQVFMGDTGALALGVGISALAILMHWEILVIVMSLVFIIDAGSTIIQWAVFKYTRIRTGTGRRVFKKTPLHHHFEMSGWPEQKVVVRFWIMGIIVALMGLALAVWHGTLA